VELETVAGMSKRNNVNPGQYKVAGRLRADEDARPNQDKVRASLKTHELREKARAREKQKQQK
jgi:hypothetical protein